MTDVDVRHIDAPAGAGLTLRARLTLAYAGALLVALVVFAVLALVVIDRSQRRALDGQLASIATTAHALVEPADFSATREAADRSQLASISGTKVASAMVRLDGSIADASTLAVPTIVRRTATTASEPTYDTVANGRDVLRLYVFPVKDRGARIGTIAVWREVAAIGELDANVALAFAFAIPAIVAIAVFAGSAIARRGLAPLADMAALASEIEAHDLEQRLAFAARDDELGRLAATLDRMLDRLQRAFERERRFTSDASHELRAPLSVIRAEADLALRRERDGATYRRALETIAAEADALEALTRDLLAAARADAGAGQRIESIDIEVLVRDVVRRLSVVAAARDVALVVASHGEVPGRRGACATVVADRAGLERALVAIVDNAVKYARTGGRVGIGVDIDVESCRVTVTDDGRGFTSEALERAFDRFWRDGDVRTMPGSGLGLGIARTIVDDSGGTLAIANAPNGGAEVVVRLPLARRP